MKLTITDSKYSKLTNYYCYSRETYENFQSVEDAKIACSKDSCCTAVYDESCDGKKNIKLCKSKSFPRASLGSCIHKLVYKKNEYNPGLYWYC